MGKAISAQGSSLFVSPGAVGAADPVYTKVNGVQTFTGFDGSPSDIDTTDLDSEAKEYQPGLQDFGAFNFDVKTDLTDPGQVAISAARTAAATLMWKLVLPDGNTGTWRGYVKTTPMTGGVDAILKGSYTTKISGVVTWTPPAA